MAKKEDNNGDIIVVKMEVNQLPTYTIDKNSDIISWGKKNNFPKFALNLYNNHPEHAAIIKGKARYLAGMKIVPSEENPITTQFLNRANRFESMFAMSEKVKGDQPLYGGFAIQVNTNLIGQPIEYFHIDMGKLRISKCLTGVYYSENWDARPYDLVKSFYPFYKEGIVGTSIYYYKKYTPSLNKIDGVYPVPDYASVMLDIDTDMQVTQFFNSLVRHDFSAGHVITFFNGKFTPEKKLEIEERFKAKNHGSENAGKTLLVFTNPEGKGTEVQNITPTGLSEQYESLNKRNQQKIITGHNVPGVLFKIKTEGTLGDRNEMDLAHELFINEYAKSEQIPFNIFLNKMLKASKGLDITFDIKQIDPIGKILPLENQNVINALNSRDPNIVSNYIIKHFGIDVPVAEISQVAPTAMDGNTNESLKNLTGRQKQGLRSVANSFSKGRITEQQALLELMPYGFNENDAKLYLGIEVNELKNEVLQVKQSSDSRHRFVNWVRLNAIEIDENDELIDTEYVNFKDSTQALRFEMNKQRMYLANPLTVSVIDLRNAILNQLKGNPFATINDLVTNLNQPIESIQTEINWLTEKKLLEINGLEFTPTEKAFNKETPTIETEIYTVYKYGLRPDLPSRAATGESNKKLLISTSRQFCRDMVDATSDKKRLTFEQIDSYNNEFSENAWDFKGGYYTEPDTNNTDSSCRHIWIGETRIKRTEKKK